MAPGAKITPRSIGKSSNMKKPRLVLPTNFLSTKPTTSGNRFSALANLDEMDLEDESNIAVMRQSKPPPLVVDSSIGLLDLQKMFGKECSYKRTSIGTKIFSSDKDKLDAYKKALLEKNIEFHTFNAKENRLFTVFLYGLPKISTNDIITDLQDYNLAPTSVTEVNTQFSSTNNAVYKVQFCRRTFNPKSLYNVKTICNVIVTWKKYKQKRNDKPTQCWNCLMYGHGGDHCHRRAACMFCANQHHTDSCPLYKNNKTPAVFTCFNCKKYGRDQTDHSANDINCPLRALYLERRANATSKNSRTNSTNLPSTARVHQTRYNSANCNSQNSNNNSVNNNNNINHNNIGYVNGSSYAQCLRANSDLFNVDELFNIFVSTLNDLQKCTTKIEQIQVVMSMVRYAYGLR